MHGYGRGEGSDRPEWIEPVVEMCVRYWKNELDRKSKSDSGGVVEFSLDIVQHFDPTVTYSTVADMTAPSRKKRRARRKGSPSSKR